MRELGQQSLCQVNPWPCTQHAAPVTLHEAGLASMVAIELASVGWGSQM